MNSAMKLIDRLHPPPSPPRRVVVDRLVVVVVVVVVVGSICPAVRTLIPAASFIHVTKDDIL